MRAHYRIVVLLMAGSTACGAPARTVEAASGDAEPASLGATVRAAGVPFVERSAWGAAAPVLPTTRHAPVRLTIHHTGVAQAPARSLEQKLRALQRFSQREDSLADGRRKRAWADVPYHLYVATDGRVGEGRAWQWVGDSNTPYDPTGHLLVVIEGAFDRDTLTDAQRVTMDRLVPALARRFAIPAERVATHRDYAPTSCPGKHVSARVPHWRGLVAGS